jgi:hypothetical protein
MSKYYAAGTTSHYGEACVKAGYAIEGQGVVTTTDEVHAWLIGNASTLPKPVRVTASYRDAIHAARTLEAEGEE